MGGSKNMQNNLGIDVETDQKPPDMQCNPARCMHMGQHNYYLGGRADEMHAQSTMARGERLMDVHV